MPPHEYRKDVRGFPGIIAVVPEVGYRYVSSRSRINPQMYDTPPRQNSNRRENTRAYKNSPDQNADGGYGTGMYNSSLFQDSYHGEGTRKYDTQPSDRRESSRKSTRYSERDRTRARYLPAAYTYHVDDRERSIGLRPSKRNDIPKQEAAKKRYEVEQPYHTTDRKHHDDVEGSRNRQAERRAMQFDEMRKKHAASEAMIAARTELIEAMNKVESHRGDCCDLSRDMRRRYDKYKETSSKDLKSKQQRYDAIHEVLARYRKSRQKFIEEHSDKLSNEFISNLEARSGSYNERSHFETCADRIAGHDAEADLMDRILNGKGESLRKKREQQEESDRSRSRLHDWLGVDKPNDAWRDLTFA